MVSVAPSLPCMGCGRMPWDMPRAVEDSVCCGAVRSHQLCMEDWGNSCGERQARVMLPIFKKGRPESVFQLLHNHTSHPPLESVLQSAGREALIIRQTLDSGVAVWLSFWSWNSRPEIFTLAKWQWGSWEVASPVYKCFVDLEKVYDCVLWAGAAGPRSVWVVIRSNPVPM